MAEATVLHVGGASPYDVVVGHDVLDRLPGLLGADVRRVALCHAPGLDDLVARVRAQLDGLEVLDLPLPDGEHAKTATVDGTPFDLREPARLGGLDLDTAYRGLTVRGDRYEATLTAPDGSGLVLWAEEAFAFFQVFTPRNFPGRELAVAVEPMTCPANAFNSGEGLRWLDPGETFEASWGLRPFPAPLT